MKWNISNNSSKARDLALVNHPNLWIESYAGYFTVNKQYNSNIFFWFFPAMKNPDDAPVLLWLEGIASFKKLRFCYNILNGSAKQTTFQVDQVFQAFLLYSTRMGHSSWLRIAKFYPKNIRGIQTTI